MLGEEARTKACRVLLAPTVNIHRSPLAGRNFECYSEDPLLSGKTAAAFVRGVQSQGVATTVKHFAGNDAEFERKTINSVIDERTLREIYLVPFELAVREGGALGIMTAYNRLNGPHCSEHVELLAGILRGEWGFEGFVVTDWFGAGSTVGSSAAGARPRDAGPGPLLRAARWPTRCAPATSTKPWSTPRSRTCSACSTASARSTTRPSGRARRSTVPSTARSPARPRRRRWCCCRTTACCPLDRSSLRTARGDRPERRAPADHGRRLGDPRAALPRSARSTRSATALGDAVDVRYERGVDIDRDRAARRRRVRASTCFAGPRPRGRAGRDRHVPRRPAAPGRPPPPGVDTDDFSFRATGRFTPDETGTAHVLARPDRRPGARAARRRGRARRRHRPAAARAPSSSAWAAPRSRRRSSSVAGEPVELVVEFVERDGVLPAGREARAAPAVTARPARPRRRGRRATPTPRSWSSAPTTTGRPRAHDRDVDGPPRRPGRADRARRRRPTRTRSWW